MLIPVDLNEMLTKLPHIAQLFINVPKKKTIYVKKKLKNHTMFSYDSAFWRLFIALPVLSRSFKETG